MAGEGPWSHPVSLVPAAGGTSVCIFPRSDVLCLCMCHLLANLRLEQLASMGAWVRAGMFRQAEGPCWYSGDLQTSVSV